MMGNGGSGAGPWGRRFDPNQKRCRWRHARSGKTYVWEDVFLHACGEKWKEAACSTDWKKDRGSFRDRAYGFLSMQSLEQRFGANRNLPSPRGETARKKPRTVSRLPVYWEPRLSVPRLEVMGDSTLVINWLNGVWKCNHQVYDERVRLLHSILERASNMYYLAARADDADVGRHIYR